MTAGCNTFPEELIDIVNEHNSKITHEIIELNDKIRWLKFKLDCRIFDAKNLYSKIMTEINTSIETQKDIQIIISGSHIADVENCSVKLWKKHNYMRWLVIEYVINNLQQKGLKPSISISDVGKKLIISCPIYN